MYMNYAPIVVFAYKRVDKISACLDSLKKNIDADKSDVFIFSDGFKSDKDKEGVLAVRAYLRELEKNHPFASLSITEQPSNKGLASSIIAGVTEILKKYENVIVVEDDLVLASDFISYMNNALTYYKDDMRYGSISAYTDALPMLKDYPHDVYVLKKGDCWGWATWKNRWEKADWDMSSFKTYLKDKAKRNEFSHLQYDLEDQLWWQYEGSSDTWAARWLFSIYMNDMWTVYPRVTRVINEGLDGSGENCDSTTKVIASNSAPLEDSSSKAIKNQEVNFEKLLPDNDIQQEIYKLSIPSQDECRKYEKARMKRRIKRILGLL